MFNNTKEFTYDDQGRLTEVINNTREKLSDAVFSYNEDGLPQ